LENFHKEKKSKRKCSLKISMEVTVGAVFLNENKNKEDVKI
jgi:hypothetical protein